MRIKKGDQVVILAGRDKGARGKILNVDPSKKRVWVEKVNFVKRHHRQSEKYPQGGIIEKEASIDISNVRLICPRCGEITTTRHIVKDDATRPRVCAKCGEELE
ncbi:MAG: 50S ribosomal protein L24 [Deltaproteobacteria bacterium]|nr:50S ribosomal protein L24 [Deltaproteobacteria bacterium]